FRPISIDPSFKDVGIDFYKQIPRFNGVSKLHVNSLNLPGCLRADIHEVFWLNGSKRTDAALDRSSLHERRGMVRNRGCFCPIPAIATCQKADHKNQEGPAIVTPL